MQQPIKYAQKSFSRGVSKSQLTIIENLLSIKDKNILSTFLIDYLPSLIVDSYTHVHQPLVRANSVSNGTNLNIEQDEANFLLSILPLSFRLGQNTLTDFTFTRVNGNILLYFNAAVTTDNSLKLLNSTGLSDIYNTFYAPNEKLFMSYFLSGKDASDPLKAIFLSNIIPYFDFQDSEFTFKKGILKYDNIDIDLTENLIKDRVKFNNGEAYQQFRDSNKDLTYLDLVMIRANALNIGGRYYHKNYLLRSLVDNEIYSSVDTGKASLMKSKFGEDSKFVLYGLYALNSQEVSMGLLDLNSTEDYREEMIQGIPEIVNEHMMSKSTLESNRIKFAYGGVDFAYIRSKVTMISSAMNMSLEQFLSACFSIISSVGTRTQNKRYNSNAQLFLDKLKKHGLTDGKSGLDAKTLTLGRISIAFKKHRAVFESGTENKCLIGIQGMCRAFAFPEGTSFATEYQRKAWHIALKIVVSSWIPLSKFIDRLKPSDKNLLNSSVDNQDFVRNLNLIRARLCSEAIKRNTPENFNEIGDECSEDNSTYFLKIKQGKNPFKDGIDAYDWVAFKESKSVDLEDEDIVKVLEAVMGESDAKASEKEMSKIAKKKKLSTKNKTGDSGENLINEKEQIDSI